LRIYELFECLYLLSQHIIILDIQTTLIKDLYITSHEVLEMIRNNDPGWKKYVPIQIAKTIKEKNLFR